MFNEKYIGDKIAKYCEDNPVKIYGDYNDCLSDELAETLIESGRQAFEESAWEWEINIQDNWYSYGYNDYRRELTDSLDIHDSDNDELAEFVDDTIRDHIWFDFSDFWDTCFRNTRLHITLEPINPETGETFDAVNPWLDFHENLTRARALVKYFGIRNYKRIESLYEHESLKICGYIDLSEYMEHESLPDKFTIMAGDTAIFHTSWNGSGCMGDVDITRNIDIACNVRIDGNSRYGVQSVYGFCESFWRDTELRPVWNKESK